MSRARSELAASIADQVDGVTARPMFGGTGLSREGVFFGIVMDETAYFRADDASRARFLDRGMAPFRPFPDKASMSYYEVPADVLEDTDVLAEWVDAACAAARRAGTRPRRARR